MNNYSAVAPVIHSTQPNTERRSFHKQDRSVLLMSWCRIEGTSNAEQVMQSSLRSSVLEARRLPRWLVLVEWGRCGRHGTLDRIQCRPQTESQCSAAAGVLFLVQPPPLPLSLPLLPAGESDTCRTHLVEHLPINANLKPFPPHLTTVPCPIASAKSAINSIAIVRASRAAI